VEGTSTSEIHILMSTTGNPKRKGYFETLGTAGKKKTKLDCEVANWVQAVQYTLHGRGAVSTVMEKWGIYLSGGCSYAFQGFHSVMLVTCIFVAMNTLNGCWEARGFPS
jgi:hypothetical protein